MKYSITETSNPRNKSNDSNLSPIEQQRRKVFLDEAIEPNDPKWASKLIEYQNSKKVFHYKSPIMLCNLFFWHATAFRTASSCS